MVLNDNLYKILKWLGLIVLPAIATLVKAIFPAWNLPYADAIATTCTALGVFVGAIIGVSSANLKPEVEEEAEYITLESEEDTKEETSEGASTEEGDSVEG